MVYITVMRIAIGKDLKCHKEKNRPKNVISAKLEINDND